MNEHSALEHIPYVQLAVDRINNLKHIPPFILYGHTAVGFPCKPYLVIHAQVGRVQMLVVDKVIVGFALLIVNVASFVPV